VAKLATLGVLTLAGVRPAKAEGPTPEERVAALKQSLVQSKEALKKYEWIETSRRRPTFSVKKSPDARGTP
jgi:hypothetical protein